MPSHIHHINFLVRDLDRATKALRTIFSSSPIFEPLPLRGANTARFELGDTWFVLVSPTHEEGAIGQLLQQQGEGVFLISLGTNSIESSLLTYPQLEETGEPRNGLANWRVQDVNVGYPFNVIFQLCEEKSIS